MGNWQRESAPAQAICIQIFPDLPMSKHPSLKSNATVGGKRSVLKRFERVKLMKERGDWKKDSTPVGLPKTKAES